MILTQLSRGLDSRRLSGPPAGSVEVRAVTADSRIAGPGVVFVAVPGTVRDGHDFALDAARAGCSAILVERRVEGLEAFEGCAVIEVRRARAALALCSANLHGRPGERLPLVGITGTNGKTTVTWLVAGAAEAAGKKVALMGTVGVRRTGGLLPATHTTPGPEVLQELLADLLEEGSELAVMEVSSHALDQERVLGCRFAAAAFTGLSRDHLDYHPDMEHYFAAKRRLFTEHLAEGAPALIFVDEPNGRRLHEELRRHDGASPVAVSIAGALGREPALQGGPAALAREARLSLDGVEAVIELPDGARCDVRSPLVGAHNLANITMAAGLAHAIGASADEIGAGLSACAGVPGRLEKVRDPRSAEEGGGRHLFVDYAHTDDALGRIIAALRRMTPKDARVIVVAGCGGDRDRGKRPLMGRAAASADVAIITSDNPRSEDPCAIIDEMLPGLAKARYAVEVDRRAAIEAAVAMARAGDVVLVAGKGHETEQVVMGERLAFDDRLVSHEALAAVAGGTREPPHVDTSNGGSTTA